MSNPQDYNDSSQTSPYAKPVPAQNYPQQPAQQWQGQLGNPQQFQQGVQIPPAGYQQQGFQQPNQQTGYLPYGQPQRIGTPPNNTAKRPLVAFALVMIAAVVSCVASAFFGMFIGQESHLKGISTPEIFAEGSNAYALVGAQIVCAILGLTAFILAIISIVNNERRGLSIFTLILTIVAPVISYIIFIVSMISYA